MIEMKKIGVAVGNNQQNSATKFLKKLININMRFILHLVAKSLHMYAVKISYIVTKNNKVSLSKEV